MSFLGLFEEVWVMEAAAPGCLPQRRKGHNGCIIRAATPPGFLCPVLLTCYVVLGSGLRECGFQW